MKPSVASLYQAVELQQQIPPLIIGERANTSGSKKFRELLLASDYQGCLRVALEQENKGAHVIDLCTAYAGRDEERDLTALVALCAEKLKATLMIDSTSPDCIEASLRIYPGRAIVNSVNLEDGGTNIRRICRVARKYGAAVVALTIDKDGMAMSAADKLRIAREIHAIAVDECGLRPWDLLFDCLTFSVGSGDETLRDAAVQTLEAIRLIKKQLPGCLSVLGLSNISFGLAPPARRILNSVFLHEAVEAGLDAAIVDAARIIPLARISEQDRQVCLDLLYNRWQEENGDPLLHFIHHFSEHKNTATEDGQPGQVPMEELIFQKILRGDREGLDDLLASLRARHAPLAIINELLVPAMRHVGELFGKGELLLPFVLQSAEVMREAVQLLEPFLEQGAAGGGTSILLATVQGDVHDIGKNLVDIILSNNGCTVHNIGIKVGAETIIEQAQKLQVDMIGLSGLLVKSALIMRDSLPRYREAGLNLPVLLGGAALTPRFVAESCAPLYAGPVVYCGDAFAALKAVHAFESGRLESIVHIPTTELAAAPSPATESSELDRSNSVPSPPFFGQRFVRDITPENLLPHLNEQALFRLRWGYHRGKMAQDEYARLIAETVRPRYERLLLQVMEENWLRAQVSYGYFPCYSSNDSLVISVDGQELAFTFPRQKVQPFLCLADYFKTREEHGDVAGFFVLTIGSRMAEEIARLHARDAYHDYLLLHGLSVELTEALASYWHEQMRRELGIEGRDPDGKGRRGRGQGARFAFGYPACPDLAMQGPLLDLLRAKEIGISLTESFQMVPEQSTSALLVHHPQARYFSV